MTLIFNSVVLSLSRLEPEFLKAVECGGCVDKHIFMVLATEESRLDTERAIHIAHTLTGAGFRIDNCDNNKACMISCQGIGYINPHL